MVRERTHRSGKEQMKKEEVKNLILYNDDINTFDHVITSLVEVCNHEPLQAEQCAVIAHYKGSCQIKEGEYSLLESLCSLLIERGLTAKIV